ncbi:MAG TPA: hypothetical protein VH684_18625 [Xanthobacteraceae bacterium]|jgi:hypothetical protein
MRVNHPVAAAYCCRDVWHLGQAVDAGWCVSKRRGEEIAFTIECSVRSAWETIYILLKRGPAPPPVYQGQYDPKALVNALKMFVCK